MELTKISKPSLTAKFEIAMKWDHAGVLTVSGLPAGKNTVLVNSSEIEVTADSDGVALMEFQMNNPAIFYMVKIKTPGGKKDQRLGFLY